MNNILSLKILNETKRLIHYRDMFLNSMEKTDEKDQLILLELDIALHYLRNMKLEEAEAALEQANLLLNETYLH